MFCLYPPSCQKFPKEKFEFVLTPPPLWEFFRKKYPPINFDGFPKSTEVSSSNSYRHVSTCWGCTIAVIFRSSVSLCSNKMPSLAYASHLITPHHPSTNFQTSSRFPSWTKLVTHTQGTNLTQFRANKIRETQTLDNISRELAQYYAGVYKVHGGLIFFPSAQSGRIFFPPYKKVACGVSIKSS